MAGNSPRLSAYPEEVEILIRALESPEGIIIRPPADEPLPPEKWAARLSQRLNSARTADRKRTWDDLPAEDPSRGKSAYDRLFIQKGVDERGAWVKITHRLIRLDKLLIEELKGG